MFLNSTAQILDRFLLVNCVLKGLDIGQGLIRSNLLEFRRSFGLYIVIRLQFQALRQIECNFGDIRGGIQLGQDGVRQGRQGRIGTNFLNGGNGLRKPGLSNFNGRSLGGLRLSLRQWGISLPDLPVGVLQLLELGLFGIVRLHLGDLHPKSRGGGGKFLNFRAVRPG